MRVLIFLAKRHSILSFQHYRNTLVKSKNYKKAPGIPSSSTLRTSGWRAAAPCRSRPNLFCGGWEVISTSALTDQHPRIEVVAGIAEDRRPRDSSTAPDPRCGYLASITRIGYWDCAINMFCFLFLLQKGGAEPKLWIVIECRFPAPGLHGTWFLKNSKILF
jgi:hypothetical protein